MDTENNIIPEYAFHDISHRASIFRTRLIDEFQLLDNIVEANSVQSPQFTTKDMKDPKMLRKLLLENPQQLIKFNQFKRKFQVNQVKKTDRRLTRAKNLNYLPFGAWAAWVVQSPPFQQFLVFLIISNALLAGVAAEWRETRKEHWAAFQMITIFDNISVLIFFGEILLKWIDSFHAFWEDGWNIFDLMITVLSAIPNFIEFFNVSGNELGLGNVLVQMRAFRIIRTLKIIVRFGNLKIIVLTIIRAADSMSVVFLLILVAAYIFGIIGHNIFDEYSKSNRGDLSYQFAFSNVVDSILSVLRVMTFDNWDLTSQDVMKVISPGIVYVYFIVWLWLGGFIFRNVFTAVLVTDFQKITEKMNEQRQEYMKNRKFDRMRKKLNRELEYRANIQQPQGDVKDIPKLMNGENVQKAEEEEKRERQQEEQDVLQKFGANLLNDTHVDTENMGSQELQRMQELENGTRWQKTVGDVVQALQTKQVNTTWPRDTLFRYLQLMENLQENMRENEELQNMASLALMSLHDD